MGAMSKYANASSGMGLMAARALYSTAIMAYLGGIAYPRWKNYRKAEKKKKEAERLLRMGGKEVVSVKKEDQGKAIKKAGPAVNRLFFEQLRKLLKIMIPGVWCYESGILSLHTLVLVIRTFLSIYVARLEGKMVKHIVRKDVTNFVWLLATWFGVAIPATFINSLIRFLESKLALALRSKLVGEAYKRYLSNQTYYRVSNLDGRLDNPDHCLTDDITSFTSACAHLYSHISKPLLDAALITVSLFQIARAEQSNTTAGPLIAGVVVWGTGRVLRLVSPRFGAMVAEEASRKGYLRYIHSRIITNAEEIAFYDGHHVELSNLEGAYSAVVEQSNLIYKKKLWYIMLEQFLMKYGWAGAGMVMISIPILTSKKNSQNVGEAGISDRTEYYTTAKNLLTSGADAMERLMTAYKEVVELAGYTQRVSSMLDVFNDCANSKYQRGVVSHCTELELVDGVPRVAGVVLDSPGGDLVLERVPIVTPNCDVVVSSLSLQVSPGQHVLISGPNGCGKSSLFRILSGLWPVYSGVLRRPPPSAMVFIPQRPLMTIGTLRDQVIYPDTLQEMQAKGWSDDDLEVVLDTVNLNHIVTREGGWNTAADWKDILSGGEKQRMGLARLFYHKPRWAMLDECTSAVSIDVEGKIYQAAKDLGVTLLTITHRPTLAKFHTHLLQFDGQGGWTFNSFSSEVFSSLGEERSRLEEQLTQVPRLEERLREIQAMIGQEKEEADLTDTLNSD